MKPSTSSASWRPKRNDAPCERASTRNRADTAFSSTRIPKSGSGSAHGCSPRPSASTKPLVSHPAADQSREHGPGRGLGYRERVHRDSLRNQEQCVWRPTITLGRLNQDPSAAVELSEGTVEIPVRTLTVGEIRGIGPGHRVDHIVQVREGLRLRVVKIQDGGRLLVRIRDPVAEHLTGRCHTEDPETVGVPLIKVLESRPERSRSSPRTIGLFLGEENLAIFQVPSDTVLVDSNGQSLTVHGVQVRVTEGEVGISVRAWTIYRRRLHDGHALGNTVPLRGQVILHGIERVGEAV